MAVHMGLFLAWILLISSSFDSAQVGTVSLPLRTRAEMIATAKRLAEHSWVCSRSNLRASCSKRPYTSYWKEGQHVQGLPYRWGGSDSPQDFDQKLAQGYAAGSHSRDGVLSCAAGVDCSGFVARCWGLGNSGHAFSTSNLRQIAGKLRANWFSDLKPGDALNNPGKHVVLFAGYNPDGTINVYEASGSASRVVFHKATWSRFKGYIPLRYQGVDD